VVRPSTLLDIASAVGDTQVLEGPSPHQHFWALPIKGESKRYVIDHSQVLGGCTLAEIVGADIGVAKREATAMDTNTTDLCLLCRS
jgi:hypothetical protein